MTDRERVIKIFEKALKLIAPPPNMTIREWADKYRILSAEGSAEAGKYSSSRTPYAIEPMERFTEIGIQGLILMWAAQLSKSETLNNIIGRMIHLDPCPMLLVQPTDALARAYSKERIQPMIRDVKELAERVRDMKDKTGGNTVSHKMFPGGFLAFRGTGTPSKLASKPVRMVFGDEIDRWIITKEGDPVSLLIKRIQTFRDRARFFFSGTPTIKGASAIETEYNNSSMGIWLVPCPDCGELQEFKWDNVKFNKKDLEEEPQMLCENCGVLNNEKKWKKAQQDGRWEHKNKDNKVLGYKLSALASPWRTWKEICKEFIEAKKDPEKLKAFVNTVLAETWEEEIKEKLDFEKIASRAEKYDELPEDVLLITLGIDIQDNRAELEFVGWGLGFESWGLGYYTVFGNPSTNEFWNDVYSFIAKEFKSKSGRILRVEGTAIDTGGHFTQETYDFISPIQNTHNVFGVKGASAKGVPVFNGFRKTKCGKIDLVSLGVDALKDIVYARLKLDTGRGYCHFTNDPYRNYHNQYFKGLCSEIKVLENGKIKWKKIVERNEPLDIRGYATGALYILGIDEIKLQQLSNLQTKKAKPIQKKQNKYEKLEEW